MSKSLTPQLKKILVQKVVILKDREKEIMKFGIVQLIIKNL